MDFLLYALLGFLCTIFGYYFGVSDGMKIGANNTFMAFVKELIEIRQRMSESAWDEFTKAYTIINERKLKQNDVKKD